MRSFNKLFVIALPRCATVSVCEGLGMLGIRLAHLGKIFGEETPPHHDPARLLRMHQQIAAGDFELDILEECDGLIDYPACIPKVFQAIDRQYPGSLFVNVGRDRDIEAWLQSVERQFVGLQLIKMGATATDEEKEFMQVMRSFREGTFDRVEFDASHYRAAYRKHQELVGDYFSDRPGDLLQIDDVSHLESEGFGLLGDFLECEIPDSLFPRVDGHSDAPREAFMRAVREGKIQSQTGIEVEL